VKNLIGLLLLPLTAYFMFGWFEHRQVYFPSRGLVRGLPELGDSREEVYLRTEDGVRLHAWYFAFSPAATNHQFVFLLAHGNAGNISHRSELYQALLSCGGSVLGFDYRGYGRSEGSPSEKGTYLDIEAAYHWLRSKGFQASQIIGYGESLGGAVVTELAQREPLGGIVLQSTFTSILDIGSEIFPWLPLKWLVTIRYDTISKLPRIRLPVLILHSRQDSMIRYHHAERNFAAANEPKLIAEITGDHNDMLADGDTEFRTALAKFLALCPPSSGESH
jgi:fermentation-respiration switch protein FrsA (DUF1100 family)